MQRPHGIQWRPLTDGEEIRVGDELLTVVHTPGHSPDHVAFWHEADARACTPATSSLPAAA